MTRDEILNMEAGRAMDVLIAEKVMGWTDIYYFKPEDTGPKSDCANGFDGKYYTAISCFSSDISAAWPVKDTMMLYFGSYFVKQIKSIIRKKTGEDAISDIEILDHLDAKLICQAALLVWLGQGGDE